MHRHNESTRQAEQAFILLRAVIQPPKLTKRIRKKTRIRGTINDFIQQC